MPRRRSPLFYILALLLFQPAVTAQTLSERALASSIDRILDEEAFENAFWGVYVLDLSANRVLYQRNARKSFVPASNIKLYTTAAALEALGTDFRYHTTLWADGPVEEGVLHGNLIVRGSGDPAIGGRFHDGDMLYVFRSWADSLRARGIQRIEGDIIGDDDVFDDVPLGYGWSWDDEPYWYAAEISGLSFNDNNVDFEIRSRTHGEPALISWEPIETDFVRVINRTLTTHPDSSLEEGYARARGTNVIHLSSRVPEGRVDRESLTVTNPTLFFVHVLREALLMGGIAIDGLPVDVDDISIKPQYGAARAERLASYTSVPLGEIVGVINKRSQNLYAEQLLRTIGAHQPVEDPELTPGSARMGIEAAIPYWVRAGIDTSRVRIADGSGLSRHNLVTPEMTAHLLRYVWTHPNEELRQAFVESLPVGGADGTLAGRFQDGPAAGNVRAKTGTLSGASALSGYVRRRDRTPLAFVIMANQFTSRSQDVRQAQDQIVELLSSW